LETTEHTKNTENRIHGNRTTMSKRPAVFLDRDGTLNAECGFVTRPDQLCLLPGAANAVRLLREAGLACVVVTNQSAVGRGLITEGELHRIHEELVRQLREAGTFLDGLYTCTAAPGSDHPERKPAPGMLLRAARELALDLTQSWMVGDSGRDILAGRRAGCRGSILVRSGHDVAGALELLENQDCLAADLAEAARRILTNVCQHGA
jgi:D-glycero-D-manno-heptose 1,7-bisphosphate phosphatase